MKKLIPTVVFTFFIGGASFAQTGLGTKVPDAKLHVKGRENENPVKLETLQKGAPADQTVVIDADGLVKKVKAALPKFFYMPATVIPTHDANGNALLGVQTLELYNLYKEQFEFAPQQAASLSRVRSNNSSTIPTLPANQLDYFVTYFDNQVFENVSINAQGRLTYSVKNQARVTARTFMNIVFKVMD